MNWSVTDLQYGMDAPGRPSRRHRHTKKNPREALRKYIALAREPSIDNQ